jgi:hypothetical protein
MTCTVIPTYSPHFGFAYNALRTHCQFVESDLYFVFSSPEEVDKFRTGIPGDLQEAKWKPIVTNDLGGDGVITRKKLQAISTICGEYKYIGVFDSEILFVKRMDTDTIYREIFESKVFKSNRRATQHHLRGVATLMGYENNEKLVQETDDFFQYWWFNDICVYEQETFVEFYQWLQLHPNCSKMTTDFACFDYLLYSIWLICNKEFKLKKMLEGVVLAGAAIETNYDNDIVSYHFRSYQDRNVNHERIPHIKVQIMIDRDLQHCETEGAIVNTSV